MTRDAKRPSDGRPFCLGSRTFSERFLKNVLYENNLRLSTDLGAAIRQAGQEAGFKATDVARHAGRSRDVLHRLERGDDVTAASLMDILRAMGLVLRIEKAGLPALAEMQQRFHDEDDDAA